MREDTIAAIATPVAEGGIGIIRISGEEAFDILEKVFPAHEKAEARRITYGHIVDCENGRTIDEVLVVKMPAPHTYTREDVCEIYCHGSVVALRKTLDLVLRSGARLAEPGEFTKRAFLNGRLDLSQAEAVMDLIKAKAESSYDAALSQLEGRLSSEISEIRAKLMDVLVQLSVNIDYPDEDIEEVVYSELTAAIGKAGEMVETLLAGADTGRIVKEGLRVAIIGKPNVGKSSLMNRLLRENRAIVTDVPGTTRDTIEETLSIRGIPVVLTDTAGIRNTEDAVEKIGIERSKAAAEAADLMMLVLDGSEELSEEDREIISAASGRNVFALFNKKDLGEKLTEESVKALVPNARIMRISAETGEGTEEILEAVSELVYSGGVRPGESTLVTNARHAELLRRSGRSLSDAEAACVAGEPLELIEIDVNEAYVLLGEIIGESASDDIINEVFSRFCLGK